MKNLIQFSLFGLFCLFIAVSCNKEAVLEIPQGVETDQIQAMIDKEPALPDLSFTSIGSTLTVSNGPCPGLPKADGTCVGGVPTTFNLTAVLANRTAIAIPSTDSFVVSWELLGRPPVFQTITGGMPGNSVLNLTSPQFTLGCPSGPPPYQLVTLQFFATADVNNDITEFKENNNISSRYKVCDDN